MVKPGASFQYSLRAQWAMSVWYLGIYPLAMLLVSFALIKTSVISEQDGSLIYRIWGSVFFLFAVSIRFKEDFDFLLTMSHARRSIWLARLGALFSISVLFSGLVVIERVIVDQLNHRLGYVNINDPFFSFSPYTAGNVRLFLYFLMLFFCCTTAGTLLGSLFYRYGRKFTLVFWLMFSSIWLIVLPAWVWSLHQQGQLLSELKGLGVTLTHFNVMNAAGFLLLLSILFSAALWINMRKLPQR